MEPECFRRGVERKALDVVDVGLQVACFDGLINSTFGELIAISHDIGVHIVLQNGFDQPDIFVVCDSSSVVDLCAQEVDDLVGNNIIVVQQHFQLSLADGHILIGEFVGDIPADGSEFSAILNDSVEQAEAEKKFLELRRFLAVFEFVIREVVVGSEQV